MALGMKSIVGIIESHKKHSEKERSNWDRWLRWYQSQYWGGPSDSPTGSFAEDGDDDLNLETNYPYAFIDTLIANVCPTNPKVTVTALRESNHESSRYREALINYTLYKQAGHRILWKKATEASMYGRGISKVVWNHKRRRAEINNVDPRYFFYDMSATKWEDLRYVCEVTVLTQQEFDRRVEAEGKEGVKRLYSSEVAELATADAYPTWLRDTQDDKTMVNKAAWDYFKWIVIYEFYDLTSKKYYHFLDGVTDPLFEGELPYRFVDNPFCPLWFNDNLVDMGGMSDIQLIAPAQERLNEIDTLELQHAQASMPYPVLNAGLCDNVEKVRNAIRNASDPYSLVEVHGLQNAPIDSILRWSTPPGLTPSFDNMRGRCIQIIEFILGLPQYSRGAVGVADVATEVALADTALRTRNGRRIKAIHDVIRDWATKIVALYEEFLDEETVLPLRLTDSKEVLEATREELAFRDVEGEDLDPMEWDYEALPYSPTENNRLVQLQMIQNNLETLLQLPGVDQQKVIFKYLDLLQLREAAKPEPPPGAMQPGAPLPGEQMPQQVDEAGLPNVMAGEMPMGTEPPQAPLPFGGPGSTNQSLNTASVIGGHKGSGFDIPGVG
jgi:hypothetical protein